MSELLAHFQKPSNRTHHKITIHSLNLALTNAFKIFTSATLHSVTIQHPQPTDQQTTEEKLNFKGNKYLQ